MQGSFPLDAAPVRARSPRLAGLSEDEVLERVQHLLDERIIREITPIFDTRALGYESMLVAAKVDAENPHRAAQVINTHPGVTHNYLRNHDFNLWFTIAVEPDSQLGLDGHARRAGRAHRRGVDPPAADAEAVQDPHGPRDGGRHRRAAPPPARPSSRWSSTRSSSATRTSRSSAPPRARCRSSASRTRRPPSGSASPGRRCWSGWSRCSERGGLRRVAAILFHRRAGFSANGMGVWKVPDERDPRDRPADGRLPRHLALLPAADLRRLAVLGLHDGPRALQGGVRRDPRLDRRGDRDQERATLYSRPSSRRSGCSTSPTTFARWEAEHAR